MGETLDTAAGSKRTDVTGFLVGLLVVMTVLGNVGAIAFEPGGAATPSSLATAEHVKPQAIAAILYTLEKRGLVPRTPDEVDGRRVVVAITAAGRSVLTDKGRAVSQRMAGILDQEFNASERQLLADAMPLLDRLAGLL